MFFSIWWIQVQKVLSLSLFHCKSKTMILKMQKYLADLGGTVESGDLLLIWNVDTFSLSFPLSNTWSWIFNHHLPGCDYITFSHLIILRLCGKNIICIGSVTYGTHSQILVWSGWKRKDWWRLGRSICCQIIFLFALSHSLLLWLLSSAGFTVIVTSCLLAWLIWHQIYLASKHLDALYNLGVHAIHLFLRRQK